MIENTDINPSDNPWTLFREWHALAEKKEPADPNAMALATVDADGMPSVRMVLFKDYGEKGIVFLTNRESRKGDHLRHASKAGMCIHWKSLKRQIRAEGPIALITDAESDAYFATRPRGSRIGAWVSQQSRPLSSRAELDRLVKKFEKEFEGKDVPRPAYWGGYRLTPLMIEFWQERDFRLHDRIVYHRARESEPWKQERLYP